MRKIILGLAALATIGIAMPAVTTQASAKTIIVKKGHPHWHPHPHHKVIVVKHR